MHGSVDRVEYTEDFDIVTVAFDDGDIKNIDCEPGKFKDGDRVVLDNGVLRKDIIDTDSERSRISRLQASVLRRRS